jgi:branched-chain amino acid transport system substrate-binding protein
MVQRLFWILAAVLIAGCSQSTPPRPIFIGHIAALSGGDRAIGEHARHGMELAVDEANKPESRIDGRPFAILHVDSKNDADAFQPETVRLITVNRVAALVGGTDINEAERIGKAAEAYETVLLTPAALPGKPLGSNVFSLNASLGAYGAALAKFIGSELKPARVAVLVDGRLRSAEPFTETFNRQAAKEPAFQVQSWNFKSDAELLALAEALVKSNPTAVVHVGNLADFVRVRQRLKGTPFKPAWLLGGALDPRIPSTVDQESLEGLYRATAAAPDDASAFAKAYAARYQEGPDSSALLGYDAIRLITEGLRRVRKDSNTRLRTELQKAEPPFEAAGGPLTFDPQQNARRPIVVVQSKGGKDVSIKRYDFDGL